MQESDVSELIHQARQGDVQVLNDLIQQYRPYLKLLARLQRDDRLTAKLDDSDLVQEAATLAVRDFQDFHGTTEPELAAGCANMAHVAAMSRRHYTRQRRDIELEQQIQESLDESSAMLQCGLPQANDPTPSEETMRRERAVLVAQAVDQLPEHYREIIILRDFEHLTLDEVGQRTGRSADSVRKMWARAVVMMRQALEGKV